MNFLLSIDKTQDIYEQGAVGEGLLYGAQIVLIGMVTIFAVLILLWGCLAIFNRVFNGVSEKSSVKTVAEEEPKIVSTAVIYTPSADEEIVAVIAAAIAAAESESSGVKYRVVSFRRK